MYTGVNIFREQSVLLAKIDTTEKSAIIRHNTQKFNELVRLIT